MTAKLIYRAAAVLLLLFTAGHMLGFTQSDPKWGADLMLASMRAIRFDVDGFRRSYWDFYLAAGLIAGLFYLFAAALAWQLASLDAEALARMRLARWAFALAFVVGVVVSWLHLFLIPIAFSTLVALLLIAGAWRAER
jgi:hypothetical protein